MRAHGRFVIYVKPPRKKVFGELSYYDFDDAAKAKDQKREAALNRVASAVTGWSTRYANFKDASFQVREVTPNDAGKYGNRKGTVIDVYKEVDKAKQARLAFELYVRQQQREAEEAEAARKAKQARKDAIAEAARKGVEPPAWAVTPAKPKAVKVPKERKPKGESKASGRTQERRAAKRKCREATGSTEKWREYL